MTNRYDASDSPEGRYQPGSNNRVLANKPGITDPQEMDDVELALLEQLMLAMFDEVTEDQCITVTDICEWHHRWLGNVYEWAGRFRSVNIGKDNFQFAAAAQVSRLMDEFNSQFLSVYTPCKDQDDDALINGLAVVHVEFVLIHPFRDGNGRLSRLLATIMALQAGKPILDFSSLDKKRPQYFSAIQAGLSDYNPMRELFRQVLKESGKSF